jgi:hypothetical protein
MTSLARDDPLCQTKKETTALCDQDKGFSASGVLSLEGDSLPGSWAGLSPPSRLRRFSSRRLRRSSSLFLFALLYALFFFGKIPPSPHDQNGIAGGMPIKKGDGQNGHPLSFLTDFKFARIRGNRKTVLVL